MTQDTNKAAQQFLDMWQDQLSSSMKDPELVKKMVDAMHAMQQAYLSGLSAIQPEEGKAEDGIAVNRDELLQLYGRIALLEQRVAELEAEVLRSRRTQDDD